MDSGYNTAKQCCLNMKDYKELGPEDSIYPNVSGCVKHRHKKIVTYIQPGKLGSDTEWDQVNLNKCLMEQINNDTDKMSETKESAKNTMYTGAVIGSIISVFVLIIVFIFAKFKIPLLIYNRFLDILEEDQPLLIGFTVITIILLSALSYLFFVVYGGAGKTTIIRGSLELSNVSDISNKDKKTDLKDSITPPKDTKYNYNNSINMDIDNQCTYIFSLKINENNKILHGLQHIFRVCDGSGDTQYPGVWFDPKRNMLLIYMSYAHSVDSNTPTSTPSSTNGINLKDGVLIEIDNINFEELYQFAIVIHNGKDKYVDVYVNAKLIISKLVDSGRHFNPPTHPTLVLGTDVNTYNTIDGEISNLINYNTPLTHREIETHYLSILSVSGGYLRYMGNLLKKTIMYPKNILFGSDSDSDCSN